MWSERTHGLSKEPVPVSAYGRTQRRGVQSDCSLFERRRATFDASFTYVVVF